MFGSATGMATQVGERKPRAELCSRGQKQSGFSARRSLCKNQPPTNDRRNQ